VRGRGGGNMRSVLGSAHGTGPRFGKNSSEDDYRGKCRNLGFALHLVMSMIVGNS
jgi:hypothetical protein